jgi:hypothetical protein
MDTRCLPYGNSSEDLAKACDYSIDDYIDTDELLEYLNSSTRKEVLYDGKTKNDVNGQLQLKRSFSLNDISIIKTSPKEFQTDNGPRNNEKWYISDGKSKTQSRLNPKTVVKTKPTLTNHLGTQSSVYWHKKNAKLN